MSERAELADFADALRECLGLDPLERFDGRRAGAKRFRAAEREARRFYVPVVELPTGPTCYPGAE